MDDVIGENEEEARRPRIARRPQTPTKAEYDAHMTLVPRLRCRTRDKPPAQIIQERKNRPRVQH